MTTLPPAETPPARPASAASRWAAFAAVALLTVGAALLGWQALTDWRGLEATEAALRRGDSSEALVRSGAFPRSFSWFAARAQLLRAQAWRDEGFACLKRDDLTGARAAAAALEHLFPEDALAESYRATVVAAIRRAEASAMVDRGDLVAAAKRLVLLGDRVGAAELWQRAGRADEAASIWISLKSPRRAADVWAAAGEVAKAADLLENQLGDHAAATERWLEAARSALAIHDSETALRHFESAARCATRAQRPETARAVWSEAGQAAAAGSDWNAAVRCFAAAGEPLGEVDALVRAGRPSEALVLVDAGHDDPRVRVELNRLIGRFDRAAAESLALGRIDDAVADWIRAARPREAVRTLREVGRKSDAAELAERHGLFERAAELWREAREPARELRAWREALRAEFRAGEFARIVEKIRAQPDPKLRGLMIEALREPFVSAGRSLELARICESLGAVEVAADVLEQAGAYLAASEAWQRGGHPVRAAAALGEVARLAADPQLAARAADLLRPSDPAGAGELQRLAQRAALGAEDFAAVSAAFGREEDGVTLAARLLALAEARADTGPHDAVAAVREAHAILRSQPVNAASQAQVARCNRLAMRLRESLDALPTLVMERSDFSNAYDAGHRFRCSQGRIVLENATGRRIARLRLTIACFERAPELLLEPGAARFADGTTIATPTGLSVAQGTEWAWARMEANGMARAAESPAAFRQALTVENLAPGEVRVVDVVLENRIPYRRWRASLVEVPADAPPAVSRR